MESKSIERSSKLKVFLDTYMYYVLINKNHRQCNSKVMNVELDIESNGLQFSHS